MPTATTIDALVVTLGLDATQFTAAQKAALDGFKRTQEEALRGGKEIEAQGKHIDAAFTSLKRGALGLLGLFMGGKGFGEFVKHVTDVDANVGRLSKQMNISTQTLSEWTQMADRMGGSGQSMAQTMIALSNSIQTFKLTGEGAFLGIFAHLHLDPFDPITKKLKTVDQMLLETADAIHKMSGPDLAEAVAQLHMIPGMNQESINVMVQGREAMEKQIAAVRALGTTTEESSKAAQNLQSTWATFTQSGMEAVRTLHLMEVATAALALISGGTKWIANKLFGEDIKAGALEDAKKRLAGKMNAPGGYSPSVGALLGGAGTRGDRNNNPGNIEYGPFAIKHGATGTDGRFAIFPSKESGEAAMDALLASGYRGLTLEQIQRKWVGNSDSGYLGSMMKATGLGADSVPDLSNPAVRRSLMRGMSRGEGTNLSATPFGAPGAAQISNSRGGDVSSSSSSVSIGNINVQTQATDAEGIARDIGPAMRRSGFAAGANYGQL